MINLLTLLFSCADNDNSISLKYPYNPDSPDNQEEECLSLEDGLTDDDGRIRSAAWANNIALFEAKKWRSDAKLLFAASNTEDIINADDYWYFRYASDAQNSDGVTGYSVLVLSDSTSTSEKYDVQCGDPISEWCIDSTEITVQLEEYNLYSSACGVTPNYIDVSTAQAVWFGRSSDYMTDNNESFSCYFDAASGDALLPVSFKPNEFSDSEWEKFKKGYSDYCSM